MTEEQQPFRDAQDRVADQIIHHFGGQPDPVERERLIGVIELGQRIAELLHELADEGKWVDTGSGGNSYDCHVTIGGREYDVNISPGSTEAEMAAWEATLSKTDDEIAELERNVLAALRLAGHMQLATDFEALISVSNIGRGADPAPE